MNLAFPLQDAGDNKYPHHGYDWIYQGGASLSPLSSDAILGKAF